jgi:hypothetical protein
MDQSARRSWQLLRETWGMLRQDRELLLFPISSAACSLMVPAGFAIPALLLIPWRMLGHSGSTATYSPSGRAAFGYGCGLFAFLVFLVSYCFMVFFNCGLIACLRIKLTGGIPSLRQGLAFSVANAGRILQWALLSAIVGTLVQALARRAGWLGRAFAGLAGLAWSLATAFVAPVPVPPSAGSWLINQGLGCSERFLVPLAPYFRTARWFPFNQAEGRALLSSGSLCPLGLADPSETSAGADASSP